MENSTVFERLWLGETRFRHWRRSHDGSFTTQLSTVAVLGGQFGI